MDNWESYKEQELKKLDEVIGEAEKVVQNAPAGSLRIIRNHDKIQYYWKHGERNKSGEYIRKSEKQFIMQLAQKEYANKILQLSKEKKAELMRKKIQYDWGDIECVHTKMSKDKQNLISPFVMNDEEYAKKWKADLQEKKIRREETILTKYPLDSEFGIVTEGDEIVRSKSEKIIADKLYVLGVPYEYEIPFALGTGGYVYPDFTVLNKSARKTFYWEHFGMMDNMEYCEKAIRKINTYIRNGITPGKNLIVTMESASQVLDVRVLEELIKEYLQ